MSKSTHPKLKLRDYDNVHNERNQYCCEKHYLNNNKQTGVPITVKYLSPAQNVIL